jgi:putative DNA primase/helicase
MTFAEIVERFENVKPCAGGVSARCSAHDDQANSLKISEAPDRTLLNCHAGCDTKDVLSAKGLGMADLFLSPRNGSSSNGHANHSSNGSARALTIAQFAAAKGFSIEYLQQHGIVEEKGGLVFHYKLKNGQKAARQRIRLALSGDKRFIWNKAEGKPVPYGLWRLDEAHKRDAADLYLVEGESDSLTLWLHQFEAIGLPGADNVKLLQAAHVAGFQRVFIVRENDGGGEVFQKGLTGRLAELEYQGQVAVVEMGRASVKDINDLHTKFRDDAGGFKSEFEALIEQAQPIELPIVGLEMFNASEVRERPVQWLWAGRIPLGKLVLFVGHPGLGKSFAALDLVARMSTGAVWPDGSPNGQIAKSVVFSAEDSIEDTIVPRLTDLGAAKGHIMLARRLREANESGEITRRSFNLARDLMHLERTLDRNPDTRIIIVDPISGIYRQSRFAQKR